MYSCGYGNMTRRLFGAIGLGLESGEMGELGGNANGTPSFSLPGDVARYAPDRKADVRHIDLDVTLDFDEERVAGTVTTSFVALFEEVSEITLDAADLEIEVVTMAGKKTPLRFWSEGEKLHIALNRTYHHGEEFGVAVRYSAHPRTGLVFVKPTAGDPELPVQAWTQGETEYHHFWFPCHDFPNDRATTSLRATVPAGFFVLSNGKLEGVSETSAGRNSWSWRMEEPYPAYLITLVAGEFSELKDSWRDIPVNYYVPKGREADGHFMFDKTPAMIEYFSERFGVDYPYEKYAQIVAEQFTGAMENASATTHSYRLLPDARAILDFTPEPVVAHELVHQWHGDMLAVRDWAHTWLKESSADFYEATWREHSDGVDEFRTEMRDYLQAYLEADARGRRPIVYNVYRKNGNELFDRHVYEKGALTLNMLRFVVGEEPFWRGVQLYTRRNQWREVITADLERAFEEATGRSLARFFEQWLYKAGHPEFNVRYSWDDDHKLARLTVRQTQEVTEQTPIFVTPVDIAFMVPDKDGTRGDDPKAKATLTTFRVQVDSAEQTFYFPLPRRPFSVRFDQGGWLIKTLDFERPAEMLRYQLARDPDVLGRIEAAEALGKLADPQSITALETQLIEESFWSVRGAIAEAISQQRNERALNALIDALEQVDEPKARRAIVATLGVFHAPEQAALAVRAADTLTVLLDKGEPSYFVEAAAATALGKTNVADAYTRLVPLLDRGSWNETIRAGVFAGLGALGDPRCVETLTSWLDLSKPQDARMFAANGLRILATTRRIEGEAQVRAVDALIATLDDPWELAVFQAIAALAAWGDQRAIPALQRLVDRSPEERAVRGARMAIRTLQQGRAAGDETRQLRKDLEELRQRNRELTGRLEALEAQASGGSSNGHGYAPATNGAVASAADGTGKRQAAKGRKSAKKG
ncbi:MAG TPA: M1 family aminopeptidase [Ktedonobacterales bacterium]|nr:M1 family aminopeptidase [Ktedonobacterales bacterium]